MATLGFVQTSYRDTPLWRALAAMRIEREGAALTFAAKLGRKQGWGKRHTYAVVEEYRRFLYLAATGDRPVTPSDDVDEAWHLHLTYSRHYWDELCGRIFGKPLHHDPTEGGAAQQDRFKDQYAATLARYEVVFGEPPRPDVWPAPAVQFPPPKRRLWPRLSAAAAASLAATACTALAGNAVGDEGVTLSVILFLGLMMFLLIRAAFFIVHDKGRGDGGGDGGCITGAGDGGCGGGGCGG